MPADARDGVFRFDAEEMRLWREAHEIALSPKSLSVLHYLIEHAGRMVSRAELLDHVWGGVHVTDDAVRYTIRQIRKALGDAADTPVFIETTPRRGWCFIGRTVRAGPQAWLLEAAGRDLMPPDAGFEETDDPFVGRETESALLMQRLARAHTGARQLVLVSGEAGLGKTRLIETFLTRITGTRNVVVARGQCVEHYGEGEAYRPVLEALERLCGAMGGREPTVTLRRYAPMWLAEIPSLTEPDERAALTTPLAGATQGRMVREFARVLEELSHDRTLVVWIDDLHWSDVSTLELLTVVARRTERARLLVIGTYRPAETGDGHHPLVAMQRDLEIHGHCHHHALPFLTAAAVTEYAGLRLGAAPEPALARYLQDRTEGNPLFMVSVVNDLVARGILTRDDGRWCLQHPLDGIEAPTSVRQLLARDLDRTPTPDRELLQVASLAGMSFSAAAVAAALATEPENVETRCEALVRAGRFLRAAGSESWHDGTVASRYAFIHALHRDVLAADLPAARRARAHREIGRRKEAGYGDDVTLHATELARHFDEGHDYARAVRYLALAGDLAARRYANREAAEHLRRALRLTPQLPPGVERDQQELALRLALSAPLAAVEGYASPELECNLARIQTMARTLDESPAFFPVLLGLWSLHILRADLPTACDIGARLLRIAEREARPVTLLQAHRVLGHSVFYGGDLAEARQHLERGLAHYDVTAHRRLDYSFGDDPVVLCHSYLAWALWFLGAPERAVHMAERAIAVGRELAHPPSLAFAMSYAAVLHQLRRDPDAAAHQAEAVIRLARDEGMALWLALATIVRGWVLADRGDVVRGVITMAEGLAAWQQTGADLGRPYFLCMVGEAYGRANEVERGLALVAEADALIARTGQHVFAAERLRVEAELLRARVRANGRHGSDACAARAETCFRDAIALARRQGARALQLRSALGLAHLLSDRGAAEAAREELALVDGLAEGRDDRDVQTATALLRALR